MPAVSVIIPVYNRAQLIPEAIESVLNQTFIDFELIVVNDGSTDNTENVVCSYKDPRLKYIKQENKGVSVARNAGLKACTGEVVGFLDSDDLFLPDKLTLQMAKFSEQPEIGLVYGRYYYLPKYGDRAKVGGSCYPHLELGQLLLGPVFTWPTVMIRRNWIDKVGGFDESLRTGGDWDLTLRLALAGCPMTCVEDPVAVIRIQAVSLSREAGDYDTKGMKVLDKIFSDPGMPKELLDLREMAYAMCLIRNTRSVYLGPQPELGKTLLERALVLYPPLLDERIDLLADTLINHVTGFSIEDPEKTVGIINRHLPGDKKLTIKLKRHLWGKFYMNLAFEAYRSRRPVKCWKSILRAITHQPSILRNRGVISILLRSVFGDAFVRRLTHSIQGPKPAVGKRELDQELY